MKRSVLMLLAIGLAAGSAGCRGSRSACTGWLPGSCAHAPETCGSCTPAGDSCGVEDCGGCGEGNSGIGGLFGMDGGASAGCGEKACGGSCRRPGPTPGPPAAQITYPYYTIRGPRDFLASRPRSIGP